MIKMKFKKLIWRIPLVLVLAFLVLALRPIVNPTWDGCNRVEGEVTALMEVGNFDIGFRLKDDPTHYYINRGIESGL
ncbi:MAG: hypothetical protein JJ975_04345, partial [Bacteroidia bacterium]|nr:hypothetical protein [Bacteroidia bacterium]